MKLKSLLLFVIFASAAALAQTHVIPQGAEIKVRTDTAIPAKPASGATYAATVSDDVLDKSGQVAVPRGSRAQLVAEPTGDKKDTALDLRAVTVNGQRFVVTTTDNAASGRPGGLGANKKTAKYVGGGALIGTVLGAIVGGGKGAAIGAVLGGAGGAGAQVYQGRDKQLPAESELSFKTAQDLQLRAAAASSPRSKGLKKR
jgi:hypothetical protein